jgi:ubiquitin-like protein Pup
MASPADAPRPVNVDFAAAAHGPRVIARVLRACDAGDPRCAHVGAILDEIDEVLEENAEEFVRSYVQKGGQ